jgi:hypothetical protein
MQVPHPSLLVNEHELVNNTKSLIILDRCASLQIQHWHFREGIIIDPHAKCSIHYFMT